MFKTQAIKDLEEKIYGKVAVEIRSGEIEQGVWARALAESKGDQKVAESKYIQLRVNKLKEKSIAAHDEKVREENEKQRDEDAIANVITVAARNSYRFKYFSIALLLIGSISLFLAAITDPYGSAEESEFFVLFLFAGLFLVPLSIYTFYQSYKIEKETDITLLHKKVVRLFWIMIPTALAVSLVGVVSIIIGLLAFIAFIKMIIDAFKFGLAYKRVLKNNLMN